MNPHDRPRLVPELDVVKLDISINFYVDICGFAIRYRRDEEAFAYLELDGAELMLQEASGPGRRFRTAPLQRPYGRGINLQIEVSDIQTLYYRIRAAGAAIIVPLEIVWYRVEGASIGSRQMVVADPDGYLLRFFEDIGTREPATHSHNVQPVGQAHNRSSGSRAGP